MITNVRVARDDADFIPGEPVGGWRTITLKPDGKVTVTITEVHRVPEEALAARIKELGGYSSENAAQAARELAKAD